MGFKADTSFLRFLSMGAAGVHQTMAHLRQIGFQPIELERYCGSNKIWTTKVKRLRLPDLLCVRTGLRLEVRAKSKLEIKMSDAPKNPDRVWDAGLRDDDLVALITSFDTTDGPRPAEIPVYFSIGALRRSVGMSKLGPPKSASEGAERDRTWPSTVPTRTCTVQSVDSERLVVLQHANEEKEARRQTYRLNGKTPYVSPDDVREALTTILAGAPDSQADLSAYLSNQYDPLTDVQSESSVDRYAAVKSLPHRDDPRDKVLAALEELIETEAEDRVALEAAGSAASLGSELGQARVSEYIWSNEERPDLRMEAVLILTELGRNDYSRDQLSNIASGEQFLGDELRQCAVWGLGKAGLQAYEDLLPYIDDADENVAMHAVAAFGNDTPQEVIDLLIEELISADPRRAPAASEALSAIKSDRVLASVVAAARDHQTDWLIATLGRMDPIKVRESLAGDPLLDAIAPILLLSDADNWLATEAIQSDMSFLRGQNL